MRYEVLIESLVYSGYGLCRLPDGKVAFVPAALPGDRALVEVTADKRRWAQARLVELLEPSPERVAPACPYGPGGEAAGDAACGGCPWQCLAYPAQLHWKRRFVVDALERIGHVDKPEALVAEMGSSPREWHYRNKVEFSVFAEGGGGRLRLGMHAQASDRLIALKSCQLLPLHLADLPDRLAGVLSFALASEALKPYRVGVRYSERSGQCEVALYSEPGGMQRGFVAERLGDAVEASSLVRVLTRGQGAARQVAKVEALSGFGNWSEQLAGERFMVSAPSFFQVNTPVAEAMVLEVLALVGRGGAAAAGAARATSAGDAEGCAARADDADDASARAADASSTATPDLSGMHIWDLYSGVGSFSLPLARAGAAVDAVELAGSSIRDLRRNIKTAGLEHLVESFPGDVARVIGQLGTADAAVVDPPRSGLKPEVISLLAESGTPELIYVSCDPQTLARDVARLAEAGYQLASAAPFDLFPQSYHVETIARFTR